MVPSFNIEELKSTPPLSPIVRTSKPQGKLFLSMQEKLSGGGVDEETSQLRRDRDYSNVRRRSLIERLFGKSWGMGRKFRGRSTSWFLGGVKKPGFDMTLHLLREQRKNWGEHDVELVVRIIKEEMSKQPELAERYGEHRGLPPYLVQKIMARLWEEEKRGNFSAVNMRDLSEILHAMKV